MAAGPGCQILSRLRFDLAARTMAFVRTLRGSSSCTVHYQGNGVVQSLHTLLNSSRNFLEVEEQWRDKYTNCGQFFSRTLHTVYRFTKVSNATVTDKFVHNIKQ